MQLPFHPDWQLSPANTDHRLWSEEIIEITEPTEKQSIAGNVLEALAELHHHHGFP